MEILGKFKDDQYPFIGVKEVREIVRAILLDENNNICLEYILDDDAFGPRDYYETPGGGIKDKENHIEALKRELAEEVGFEIEVIDEIGEIDDFYNLIKRKNHNYYYLARIVGKCESHLEPDEKRRINKIIFVSIDEAISLYENMQNILVGKLVKQRELPILRKAKMMIEQL